MWSIILGLLGGFIKPVFEFLNKRVDAQERMHVSDNATITSVHGAQVAGQINADIQNTQVRLKEGPWSPWVVMTIFGFMAPFAWHTWQVTLDSSRWLPCFGAWYFPSICEHVVGSWRIAALPGLFETTEHAVIQSLFVGAGVAVGGIALIKAMKGRG